MAEVVAFLTPSPPLPWRQFTAAAARGDGHAVLVLPALMRGDGYTVEVRQFLAGLGYTPYGWELGVNTGPTRRVLDGVADRLADLAAAHGPVSVVGFSMGGLFARWLSLHWPDRVRQVITVCSPIHDAAGNFWLPLKPFLGMWRGSDLERLADEAARPLPVPLTCLFSHDDGVVNWPSCCDASVLPDDTIVIDGPHALIARNARVMAILAERLARSHPVERARHRLPP